MAALEDDATQKAGIVMVGYNMGPRRVMDRKAAFAIQSMRRHLPYHMASIHFCYDDFRIRPMMTVAMLVMGSTTRVRFRAHYGRCIRNPISGFFNGEYRGLIMSVCFHFVHRSLQGRFVSTFHLWHSLCRTAS